MKFSVGITIFGAWMRYICLAKLNSFYLMLLPQILIAIAAPFLNNSISKIVFRWFPENEVSNWILNSVFSTDFLII